MSKEMITDELLEHLANEYLIIKAKFVTHNVGYITFLQFVEKRLKERSGR